MNWKYSPEHPYSPWVNCPSWSILFGVKWASLKVVLTYKLALLKGVFIGSQVYKQIKQNHLGNIRSGELA